jgi:hypothetical protein
MPDVHTEANVGKVVRACEKCSKLFESECRVEQGHVRVSVLCPACEAKLGSVAPVVFIGI